MSRLIRMDSSGHSTLAEWSTDDQAAYDAAVEAASSTRARAAPRRCASYRARPAS
jgi:hypothetical protein